MSKKQIFIDETKKAISKTGNAIEEWYSPEALDFWNALLISEEKEVKFTENGKLVLNFMKENKEVYNNLFKAKDIGEGLQISSRVVSGAMRKLVTDNYVEKIGQSPVVYSLTTLGNEVEVV